MSNAKKSIDMTQGSILKNVIKFVIPLIIGNILQLLYNAADLIVVGRFAGSNATASVGATGSVNNLIVNICIGLSVGAGVLVSRHVGAKNNEAVSRSVHTAMLLGIVSGVVSMIAGLLLSSPLLTILGTPKGVVFNGALLYMRIYFLGVPAAMVYNFGASILRAVGDTKRPLYILSLSGLVNVALNLVFVIKFHMGVAGVAAATSISNYISAIAVVVLLSRTNESYKLFIKKLHFYKEELKDALVIGIPAGIQSSVFNLSNSVIQSAVNSFGPAAMAGSAASGNIEGFVYTAMNAFYQATLTAVSQNYGAKKEKRIYKVIVTCVIWVAVVGSILGALSVIFSRTLLGIYITDSKDAIELGVTRMMYTGFPYFLCGVMEVLGGALRGIGHSNIGMINSLIGACGVRVLWVAFVLPIAPSMQLLFLCWPVSWLIVIIMHTLSFMLVRKNSMYIMRSN